MTKKFLTTVGTVLGITAMASIAFAGIPFAPFSTCNVTIDQTGEVRAICISNFEPDVTRLSPGPVGAFDNSVTFNLVILDALANPVSGASVSAYELNRQVNIATAGDDTDVTDASGNATISLTAAAGYGDVGICADGVLICQVEVRSPDVAAGALPAKCNIPTGTSQVNGADFTNSSCGFIANFGTVTPGVNNWWDLTCDNAVGAADVNGLKGAVNGALPHFGDIGATGAKNTCP